MEREQIIQFNKSAVSDTFRNEWRLQLEVLEKSLHFLNAHLVWALERVADPVSEKEKAALAFGTSEAPLVMKDAREAVRVLKLLTSPKGHCD